MWEDRADRARRDIAALAAEGLGVRDTHAAAIDLIGRAVAVDLTCWAALDPETLSITGMTSGENRIPPQFEVPLAVAEYSPDEPHQFAGMAAHGQAAARLSDLSPGERAGSRRLNEVWRPLGVDQEIRVLFQVDGACWGAAGMVRSGPDFTSREEEFLLDVAPAVAAATRAAVRAEVAGLSPGGRPAVAVVGPRGEVRSATAAARDWQESVDEAAPGRFALLMSLMAAGARTRSDGGFRVRVHDAQGRWAILEASGLIGADDEVAVSIHPATGDQLLGLLLAAFGLTAREREICRQVLTGRSTRQIGRVLDISPNTVQDHLKSIFTKTGAHSRGELSARLRPYHQDGGA